MKTRKEALNETSSRLITGARALDEALELLKLRTAFLKKAEVSKEKGLRKAPEGTLKVSRSNNRIQYYHRTDPHDKNGRFIQSKELKLAYRLAQKAEDQKELVVLRNEIAYIGRFLENYPRRAEDVYEALTPERRLLVLPLEESDEEFIKNWQSQEFIPHPIPPENDGLVTENGETVRSRAELTIANMLKLMKIPYFYEKPLYLEGAGTVYPDMTALCVRDRVEKYIEYFGMMHIPEYSAKAVKKINDYEKNGIYLGERLIAIFEAEGEPLNTRHVRALLQRHFL